MHSARWGHARALLSSPRSSLSSTPPPLFAGNDVSGGRPDVALASREGLGKNNDEAGIRALTRRFREAALLL